MNKPTMFDAIEALTIESGDGMSQNPLLDTDPLEIIDRVSTALEAASVAFAQASAEALAVMVTAPSVLNTAGTALDALAHSLEVAKQLIQRERFAAAGGAE